MVIANPQIGDMPSNDGAFHNIYIRFLIGCVWGDCMRKIVFALMLLSLFLIACQPAAQPAAPGAPSVPIPTEPSPETAPAETQAEVPPAPLENIPAAPEGRDLEQRCYGLLSEEDFTSTCGGGKVVLTPKISEKSCWVNIADHLNNKLTGGFTVVDWKKAEEANREFDRGVKMRKTQGAGESQTVGERSYEYQEIARHNVVWVQGTYLTKLGAMTDLCPSAKLIILAQKIDLRLR